MNIKHRAYHLILLLLFSAILVACTSVPYNRLKTPSISGIIRVNNEAAAGLSIYLSIKGDDKFCYKAAATTVTGPNGEFHFHSLKEQLPREPIAKHFLDEWNICAQYNGQRIQLHSGDRYGLGSVKSSLNLKCELTKSRLNNYCSVH